MRNKSSGQLLVESLVFSVVLAIPQKIVQIPDISQFY